MMPSSSVAPADDRISDARMRRPPTGAIEGPGEVDPPFTSPRTDGALERQPSQRTFDETLTVALALFSHSDNVLSKYRADGRGYQGITYHVFGSVAELLRSKKKDPTRSRG
jgi:hypothetical protein